MKKKSSILFDFLTNISESNENIWSEENQKEYKPYIINRFLAAEMDTLLYANDMNLHRNLSPKQQYNYLKHSIRKRKRYFKWDKKQSNEVLDVIVEYYNISENKAKSFLDIHTTEQIDYMRSRLKKGGM